MIQVRKIAAFLKRQGYERRKAKGRHELYTNGENTFIFSPRGKDADKAFVSRLIDVFGYDTVAGL